MWAYILRRLLIFPITLVGLSVLVFSLSTFLTPEERLMAYIHSPLQVRSPEVVQQMIEKFGLRDPVYQQYWRWFKGVVQGDFGFSTTAQEPVFQAIMNRLPATLELVLFAIFPIIIGGIVLGVISAAHHNKPLDHVTRLVAITGWSMPTFLLALLIMMVFYGELRWFLPQRISYWAKDIILSADFVRYTGMNVLDGMLNHRWDIVGDALRHVMMPMLTLVLVDWASLCRITRSSMLESLHQDYVRTARAKGQKERVVIFRHALRNAMLPAVTFGGMLIAWLLAGVVITETIFNYEGVGSFAASAAQHLDFAGILGFAMFFGTLMISMNLLVDLTYAFLDPRVRLD
ncbi:ABC transporter permease [Candidatus Bipolaricaulota bacterium]